MREAEREIVTSSSQAHSVVIGWMRAKRAHTERAMGGSDQRVVERERETERERDEGWERQTPFSTL